MFINGYAAIGNIVVKQTTQHMTLTGIDPSLIPMPLGYIVSVYCK